MSVDLITEIQAGPREFARRYENMAAQLAQARGEIARLEMLGNGMTALAQMRRDLNNAQELVKYFRSHITDDGVITGLVKRDRQRSDSARKVAQWAREHVAFEFYSKVVSDMNAAYAERDAARAEVARLLKELGK